MSKFADRVVGWVHTTKSKHQVSQQLVRQLVHSLFGDNNRVPFYWWWKETVLRRKTSTNVLSKIVEIAKFLFLLLKPCFSVDLYWTCESENTKFSPNFLIWKFCGKARITQKSVDTVRFRQISTSRNQLKLRYFM